MIKRSDKLSARGTLCRPSKLSRDVVLTAQLTSCSTKEDLGDRITLRPGTVDDAPAMVRLMDIAVDWLSSRGIPDQWGTKRPSEDPDRVKQITDFAKSGGTWVAIDTKFQDQLNSNIETISQEKEGNESQARDASLKGVVGALTVGDANAYIKPVTEPELYVNLLISHRAWAGYGLGRKLLEQARKMARESGISLLRVDCYAGGDGQLVRYYESQGFEKTDRFEIKGWQGQVLAQRLT